MTPAKGCGENVAQWLDRLPHERDVGGAALVENPEGLRRRQEAALRPDPLGSFPLLVPVSQEGPNVVILAADLAPLLLGRPLAGAGREEPLERELRRRDVLRAVGDRPGLLRRPCVPPLGGAPRGRREAFRPGL